MNILYQLPVEIIITVVFDFLTAEDLTHISQTSRRLYTYHSAARKNIKEILFENYSSQSLSRSTPYYSPLKVKYRESAIVVTTANTVYRWLYTKSDSESVHTEQIATLSGITTLPIRKIKAINRGQSFFVIDEKLKLWGFGKNLHGILGFPEEPQLRIVKEPTLIPALSNQNIISININSTPLVFVATDLGEIYYWGHEPNAIPTLLQTKLSPSDILGLIWLVPRGEQQEPTIAVFDKTQQHQYIAARSERQNDGHYISHSGQLYVWGRRHSFELGQKDRRDSETKPTVVSSLLHEHATNYTEGPHQRMAMVLCQSGKVYISGRDCITRNAKTSQYGYVRFQGLPYMRIVKLVLRENVIFALTNSGMIYGWGDFWLKHLLYSSSRQFSDGASFRGHTSAPALLKPLTHIKFVDLTSNDRGLWVAISENGVPYCWSINTRTQRTHNPFIGSSSYDHYCYYSTPQGVPVFRRIYHPYEKPKVQIVLERSQLMALHSQTTIGGTIERKVESPLPSALTPNQALIPTSQKDVVGTDKDSALYSLVYSIADAAEDISCDTVFRTALGFMLSVQKREQLTPFHQDIICALSKYYSIAAQGRGMLAVFYLDWWGAYSKLKIDIGLLLKIFQCYYPQLFDDVAVPQNISDFGIFAIDGIVLDIIEQMVDFHYENTSWHMGFYKQLDKARQRELYRRDKVLRQTSKDGATLTLFFSKSCETHMLHKLKEQKAELSEKDRVILTLTRENEHLSRKAGSMEGLHTHGLLSRSPIGEDSPVKESRIEQSEFHCDR